MAVVIDEKNFLLKSVMERVFKGVEMTLVPATSSKSAFSTTPTIYYGSTREFRINTVEESIPVPINIYSVLRAATMQKGKLEARIKDPLFIPLWKYYNKIRPDYPHRFTGNDEASISDSEKKIIEDILKRLVTELVDAGRVDLADQVKPWKDTMLELIDSHNLENIKRSVFLLNHLLFGKLDDSEETLRDNFRIRYENEFNLDTKNSFFNVLLIDDFFFLHVYQLSLIERLTAGFATDGCVCPLIHFDFECIPQNVEKRLDQKAYQLILLDIDFGKLVNSPNNVEPVVDIIRMAAKKEIPIVTFSKFKSVDKYKPLISVGKLDGEISKDDDWQEIFNQIYYKLREKYDVKEYTTDGWKIIKSSKLRKVGYFKNIQFKGTELDCKKQLEHEFKNADFSELFLPSNNGIWKFLFLGRKPDFVNNTIKYLEPIKRRLGKYGLDIIETQVRLGDREERLELTIKPSESSRIVFAENSRVYDWEGRNEEKIIYSLIGIGMDLNHIVVPNFSKTSIFDVVGPVTIGPSSSHTAGANRIARLARNFAKALSQKKVHIERIEVEMLNSFYHTGKGHGSDYAIAAGLCGRMHYDPKLPFSITPESRDTKNGEKLSEQCKLKGCEDTLEVNFNWNKDSNPLIHNNSIRFHFYTQKKTGVNPAYVLTARSWGGGNVQITKLESGRKYFMARYKNGKTDLWKEVSFSGLNEKKEDLEACNEESTECGTTTNQYLSSGNLINEDKKFLSGKDDIEIRLGSDIYVINSIFPSSLSEVDLLSYRDDQKQVPIFIQEAPSYEDSSPDTEVDKPICPSFLTLNDFLDRSEKDDLWKFAVNYERWIRYIDGKTVTQDWIRNVMKEYLRISLGSVEQGLSHDSKSFTDYHYQWGLEEKSNAEVYDRWNQDITLRAKVYAMAVNEANAKMSAPVLAAPTCGSCGVIPGVLAALRDYFLQTSLNQANIDEKSINGLLVAALVGLVINNEVPTAGGEAGCQAELGTAAAMAAAMITFMLGGGVEASIHATALVLKNSLGLVCDPVMGGVEFPCIKRAGLKAAEAVQAGFSALHGVRSEVSPWDLVGAMKEISTKMDKIYKETGIGGCGASCISRDCVLRIK